MTVVDDSDLRAVIDGVEPFACCADDNGSSTQSGAGFSWSDPAWFADLAATEDRCRAYLEDLRWPDGVACPRCDSTEVGRLPARKKFYCRSCRYHFSVTAGTVFHNSHLPLWKWFLTVAVMLDSEDGVPSNQLARVLGGSYKTAWFAQHRVRAAIEQTARRLPGWCEGPRDGYREPLAAVAGGGADQSVRVFDRPIVGPFHQMGLRYLSAYQAEQVWRARCRRRPDALRETVLCLLECDPLEYESLVSRAPSAPVAVVGTARGQT